MLADLDVGPMLPSVLAKCSVCDRCADHDGLSAVSRNINHDASPHLNCVFDVFSGRLDGAILMPCKAYP